jgi:hypothetical protein
MHFLFNLLRIKEIYMFRALLAHSQESLHKRHLVYFVRVMSVGCNRIEVELVSEISWCSQLTQHACNIPSAVCAKPPEDQQVMLEKFRGP